MARLREERSRVDRALQALRKASAKARANPSVQTDLARLRVLLRASQRGGVCELARDVPPFACSAALAPKLGQRLGMPGQMPGLNTRSHKTVAAGESTPTMSPSTTRESDGTFSSAHLYEMWGFAHSSGKSTLTRLASCVTWNPRVMSGSPSDLMRW